VVCMGGGTHPPSVVCSACDTCTPSLGSLGCGHTRAAATYSPSRAGVALSDSAVKTGFLLPVLIQAML
jgi:hypothetical protein